MPVSRNRRHCRAATRPKRSAFIAKVIDCHVAAQRRAELLPRFSSFASGMAYPTRPGKLQI
jgi:hypothetical protein